MSGMLTLTKVVENKFQRLARNADIEALCDTNAKPTRDTMGETDELNRNSIRVISRTVSVHDDFEHSVCESEKRLDDNECTCIQNHKKKTDQENVDKPNSGGILSAKTLRNQQYETADGYMSTIEKVIPKKHGEFGIEYEHSLNKDSELHLDHRNPTDESTCNRSLLLKKKSDRTHGKVLAYRPGTKVDNFRRDYQYTFPDRENIVEGLDVEEGNKIWDEVEKIIDRTDSKIRKNSCLSDRFCGSYSRASSKCESDSKSADNSRSSLNSIEFSPRFNNKSHKQSWRLVNKIWSYKGLQSDTDADNMKSSENVSKLSDIFVDDDVKKKHLPKKWTGLINNIWSTVDDKIVHGQNRNQTRRSNLGRLYWSDVRGECKDKSVTMTTMLPRIAPPSTPLPTGLTQPPPRSHSSASMYVPYPPKELSSSIDFVRIPGRINPLAPPPPRRRINWTWETTDQHYENEKRSLLMQKREHTRYHSAWSKAFYGAPAEKEAYRRHCREVLKQQMSDKSAMAKEEFKEKIKETEQAISYDKTCRMNDAQEYYRKHSYLMQYRDGNKQQMEDRWAQTRQNRDVENRIDRERLRYNPINWSCTLK